MTNSILTQEELKELLNYDAETGIFTRKVKRRGIRAKIGDIAGRLRFDGYVAIKINGKIYRGHRLAWLYVYGNYPNGEIDHINLIKSDNRIENLREVSRSENMQNIYNAGKSSTTGFRGIDYRKSMGLYQARIQSNGKRHFLGYYSSAKEAHDAYVKAKKELHI